MIDWTTEWPQIQKAAALYHVDPYFIGAIRHAENGSPGKEFGVLSVSAPTYTDQLREACESVAHKAAVFDGEITVLTLRITKAAMVLVYSDAFIQKFASVWAPEKVSNDPHNLNANWANNVRLIYYRLMDEN